jgi:hypothetical protein
MRATVASLVRAIASDVGLGGFCTSRGQEEQSLVSEDTTRVQCAAGVVGDLCRALGTKLEPWSCDLLEALHGAVLAMAAKGAAGSSPQSQQQSSHIKTVRSNVLVAIGDVALALNEKIAPHLPLIMPVLYRETQELMDTQQQQQQHRQQQHGEEGALEDNGEDDSDESRNERLCNLCDTYTGILQGLNAGMLHRLKCHVTFHN